MNHLTINQLVGKLRTLAQNHSFIYGFGYGDLTDFETEVQNKAASEQGLSTPAKLPLLWVSPIRTRAGEGSLYYDFDVIVGDLVKEGDLNRTEVESDCHQVCLDVLSYLYQEATGELWDLLRESNITPFYERYDNGLTGQQMNVTLEVMFSYDNCIAPFAQKYFYGEEPATSPTTEFDFNGALANTNYATIYLGQYQSGVTGGPTKSITGFTVPTDTGGNTLPWIAALLGTSIPGITVGTATLPAGQTNYAITHASISGAHTIIPCDVNLVGMVFNTINSTKTATGFEVADTGSGGRLDYIIVEDGVLANFRSGTATLAAGGDNIPFSNLGTNDYTALVFSVNYVGKLYDITKNNASIDVANDDADEVNYILIVN